MPGGAGENLLRRLARAATARCSCPRLSALQDKGYDVLFMTEDVDEFVPPDAAEL